MYWETNFTFCVNIKTRFQWVFLNLFLSFQYTGDIVYCTYSRSMKWTFAVSFG